MSPKAGTSNGGQVATETKVISEILNKSKQKKQSNTNRVDIPQRNEGSKEILADYNSIARIKSVEAYIEIVKQVVNSSSTNLNNIDSNKKSLRKLLIVFFIILLSLQFLVLSVLMFVKGFCGFFDVSDTLLLTFMTSIFIETLGAIIIMIRYAFKSEEEVSIIKILNDVVRDYQKEKDQDISNSWN